MTATGPRRRSAAHPAAAPGLRHLAAGPDGGADARQLRAARRVGDRPPAGRGEGRLRRRHRRLVRGDGAVPPSARHPDPAHGDHPAPEGTARRGARPLRRHACVHRARRSPACWRGSTCRASCTASWPTPASARPAAVALAGMLPRLLATVEDGRARRLRRAHRAAHPGRPRRRPGGGARAARPGGRRPPPGGVRLRARPVQDAAGQPGGGAAHRDRGAGARAGRPAGRLGARARRSRGACWRR